LLTINRVINHSFQQH